MKLGNAQGAEGQGGAITTTSSLETDGKGRATMQNISVLAERAQES